MKVFSTTLFSGLLLLSSPLLAQLQQPLLARAGDTLRFNMPQIEIMAEQTGLFQRTPGSVTVVNSREIKLIAPISGNEIMRRSAGVHVVDEEGSGLRTNIGIRGLDPDRSRNVLILEDGIPVALNPYGEPEMYYTPAIDRMSRVEIVKGSGQILFGPQTIGGVINYITADPTLAPETNFQFRAGGSGYFSGQIRHSQTNGNTGVMVNYLHKRADQLGHAGFNIHDFSTKLKFRLSEKSTVGVKLGIYDESSNATYIDLTQGMFDQANQDFVLMAPDDRLNVRRYSLSATHQYQWTKRLSIKTTAYAYTTTRNWQRQDFSTNSSNNTLPSNFSGQMWGDSSIAGGAIFMRETTTHRNRQFEVAGIESRVNYSYTLLGKAQQLDGGVRLQYEGAYEQLLQGRKTDARSGDMLENEIRSGLAASLFVQNRTDLTDKISVTAGLRYENFDYERNILRRRFSNVVRDTNLVAGSLVQQLIPGLGINWNINSVTSLFAGIHRGFAPPRVKDAIDGSGTVQALDAELSWNTEIGARLQPIPAISLEATAFRLNFSNQIIPVSQSSGGAGAGLINGGKTFHQGIEFASVIDFGKLLAQQYSLQLQLMATYIDAQFAADRFVAQGNDTLNISGNRTPYAPEWLLTAALSFEHKSGLALRLSANHVGEQYGDILNRTVATANGQEGKIAAYTVLDLTALYAINQRFSVNVAVKNLTNERYMVSRRPQGIRVGLPTFISAGVDIRL